MTAGAFSLKPSGQWELNDQGKWQLKCSCWYVAVICSGPECPGGGLVQIPCPEVDAHPNSLRNPPIAIPFKFGGVCYTVSVDSLKIETIIVTVGNLNDSGYADCDECCAPEPGCWYEFVLCDCEDNFGQCVAVKYITCEEYESNEFFGQGGAYDIGGCCYSPGGKTLITPPSVSSLGQHFPDCDACCEPGGDCDFDCLAELSDVYSATVIWDHFPGAPCVWGPCDVSVTTAIARTNQACQFNMGAAGQDFIDLPCADGDFRVGLISVAITSDGPDSFWLAQVIGGGVTVRWRKDCTGPESISGSYTIETNPWTPSCEQSNIQFSIS